MTAAKSHPLVPRAKALDTHVTIKARADGTHPSEWFALRSIVWSPNEMARPSIAFERLVADGLARAEPMGGTWVRYVVTAAGRRDWNALAKIERRDGDVVPDDLEREAAEEWARDAAGGGEGDDGAPWGD